MHENTVKAFYTLHEKILEAKTIEAKKYNAGYQTGLRHIRAFFKMTVEELRAVRQWYIATHNPLTPLFNSSL